MMGLIAFVSYLILGVFSFIAFIFGFLVAQQIKEDNRCDEESYRKENKRWGFIMFKTLLRILGIIAAIMIILCSILYFTGNIHGTNLLLGLIAFLILITVLKNLNEEI